MTSHLPAAPPARAGRYPGGDTIGDRAPARGDGARGAARGGLANMLGAGFAGLTGVVVTWLVARGLGT